MFRSLQTKYVLNCDVQILRTEADSSIHTVVEDWLTKALHSLQHTTKEWITEQGSGMYRAHFKVIMYSVGSLICLALLCDRL